MIVEHFFYIDINQRVKRETARKVVKGASWL